MRKKKKERKENKIPSPGGLEPPTFRLTAERANRLRHGDNVGEKEKILLKIWDPQCNSRAQFLQCYALFRFQTAFLTRARYKMRIYDKDDGKF